MPEEDALVCLRETTDRIHTGLKHFRNESLDWISFRPSHDRADYVIPIGKGDWRELSVLAKSRKKARQESLSSIEKSRKELLDLLLQLDKLDRLAPDLPPPLPRLAGWKEQKQKLIAAMRKKRMPQGKIDAILKAEEKRDFKKKPATTAKNDGSCDLAPGNRTTPSPCLVDGNHPCRCRSPIQRELQESQAL